jgi:hypothetical protein
MQSLLYNWAFALQWLSSGVLSWSWTIYTVLWRCHPLINDRLYLFFNWNSFFFMLLEVLRKFGTRKRFLWFGCFLNWYFAFRALWLFSTQRCQFYGLFLYNRAFKNIFLLYCGLNVSNSESCPNSVLFCVLFYCIVFHIY